MEHNPALSFFEVKDRIDLRGYRDDPERTDVATAERLVAEVKERSPSCVSFYGHGDWDPGDAENSAIYLAPPLDEEGAIPRDGQRSLGASFPTGAIRDLSLANCRLFIFAGCETGMIDLNQAPDEFIGLPAAALEGGAAGAMASLWPVGSVSTEALIRCTLADHKDTDDSLAQSLRRAQLSLRDDPGAFDGIGQGLGPTAPDAPGTDDATCPRSPFVWAAFSLFGT